MKMLRMTMLLGVLLVGVNLAVGQEDSGRKFSITLSGAAEVPGPGDADGSGTAEVRLNQGQNQICFELSVSNIATATAAHIHEGAEGASGPPVVTLTAPGADGTSTGCVDALADLIKRIRQTPENFYVNVHNAEFPNGAVRGQLAKKTK